MLLVAGNTQHVAGQHVAWCERGLSATDNTVSFLFELSRDT